MKAKSITTLVVNKHICRSISKYYQISFHITYHKSKFDKMKKEVKQNLCTSILPMYYLAKTIGMAPYSHKVTNKETNPISTKRDVIFVFGFLTVYLLMGMYTLRGIYKNESTFDIIPKFAVIILAVFLIWLQFLFITFNILFRNNIIKSIKSINYLDITYKSIGIPLDYKDTRKHIQKRVIYIILSTFLKTFLTIKIMHWDIIQQLTILSTSFVKVLMKNQFMVLSLQIRNRYQKINDKIRSMFQSDKHQKIDDDVVNNMMKMLYVLCRLHYKLRQVVEFVTTAYSVQLFFYLGAALADIIFQTYFLYVVVGIGDVKKTVWFFGSTVTWLVDEVYELYTLVNACASTANTVSFNLFQL